jgi:hypothetical protein
MDIDASKRNDSHDGHVSRASRRRRQRAGAGNPVNQGQGPAPVVAGAPSGPIEPLKDRRFWVLLLGSRLLVAVVLLTSFYGFAHDSNLWNRWFSGANSVEDPLTAFTNWDAQHYLKLARDGFAQADEQGRAFFPVFPLLIAGAQIVVRDWTLAGLLVTLVCSMLALRWFLQIARTRFPAADGAAYAAAACLLAYPTAFFLTVVYTEAVFCAALLCYMRGVQVGSRAMRLGAALLLPLCRPQGILLASAVLAIAVVRLVRGDRRATVQYAFDLLAFGVGAAIYLSFCWAIYGHPFAGIDAQKVNVFGNSLAHALDPLRFLNFLSNSSDSWFSYLNGGLDKLFAFVMLSGTFVVLRLRDGMWTCMYLVLIWLPASMGSGGAFSRYAFLGVPFLALAALEIWSRSPRVLWCIAAVSSVAQVLLAGRFAVNLWVG